MSPAAVIAELRSIEVVGARTRRWSVGVKESSHRPGRSPGDTETDFRAGWAAGMKDAARGVRDVSKGEVRWKAARARAPLGSHWRDGYDGAISWSVGATAVPPAEVGIALGMDTAGSKRAAAGASRSARGATAPATRAPKKVKR